MVKIVFVSPIPLASVWCVSIPASIENIYSILDGLLDICAKAEGEEIIKKYADRILKNE